MNFNSKHDNTLNESSEDLSKSLKGHIVNGCSQLHYKNLSGKSSSEDASVKNLKWRTSKSINEKSILMEKFESSLKERLLSSQSFTRQVPLFDGTSKERIRMRTPVKSKSHEEGNNESVYNTVFPFRKDVMDMDRVKQGKELFSIHHKDSEEWLKQLEKGDQEINSSVEKQSNKTDGTQPNINNESKQKEIKLSRKESKTKLKKENELNQKDKKSKKKETDDKDDHKIRKSMSKKKDELIKIKPKRSKSLNKNEKGTTKDNSKSLLINDRQKNMSSIFPQQEYKVMFVEAENVESKHDSINENETVNEKEEVTQNQVIKSEISQEVVEEEDCIENPCNEPKWFEDYGIDKKRRKLLGETSPEEEIEISSEESVGKVQEVVEDQIEQEIKKKIKSSKKQKASLEDDKQEEAKIFLRDLLDTPEKIEEIEEPVCKTLREVKTVPLVTVEETVLKHKLEHKGGEEDITPVDIPKPKEMPTEYLQKYVGQYLIAGLAQVALLMPKDPVEYLAHWIIKERRKEQMLEEVKQIKAEIAAIRNRNLTEKRKKMQLDDLQNELAQGYKDDPIDHTLFDSESEIEHILEEVDEIPNEPDMYEEYQNKI